jgi:hypothetical protein
MDGRENKEEAGDVNSEYESVSSEWETKDGSYEDTGAETDNGNWEHSDPHAGL